MTGYEWEREGRGDGEGWENYLGSDPKLGSQVLAYRATVPTNTEKFITKSAYNLLLWDSQVIVSSVIFNYRYGDYSIYEEYGKLRSVSPEHILKKSKMHCNMQSSYAENASLAYNV